MDRKVIVLFEISQMNSGHKEYEFQCFDTETNFGPLIKLNEQVRKFRESVLLRETAPSKTIADSKPIAFEVI